MYDRVNILLLGIDYKKYLRFKEVAPPSVTIPPEIEGTKEVGIYYSDEPPSKNPDKDDVIFCLEFVLEAILEWQEIW